MFVDVMRLILTQTLSEQNAANAVVCAGITRLQGDHFIAVGRRIIVRRIPDKRRGAYFLDVLLELFLVQCDAVPVIKRCAVLAVQHGRCHNAVEIALFQRCHFKVDVLSAPFLFLKTLDRVEHGAVAHVVTVEQRVFRLVDLATEVLEDTAGRTVIAFPVTVNIVGIVVLLHNGIVNGCIIYIDPADHIRILFVVLSHLFHVDVHGVVIGHRGGRGNGGGRGGYNNSRRY